MEKENLKETKQHGTDSFKIGFYCLKEEDKRIYVKHHWHEEIELIHLEEGSYLVEINMEKYKIEEECFIFVNSEELHYIALNPPFTQNAVVFDMKMLNFDMFDDIQRKILQPLTLGRLKFPRIITKGNNAFNDIAKEYKTIYNAYKESGELTDAIEGNFTSNLNCQIKIKTSLLKIIGVIYENNMFVDKEKYANDYRIEYIKNTITYIQSNYNEKIKIADLSKIVNMNEQYFCRFFKSMIGKSPMEYVNEYRVKKAEEMLMISDKKIVDICLECGFNNMGNFINIFKRITGTTPLKYRKQ